MVCHSFPTPKQPSPNKNYLQNLLILSIGMMFCMLLSIYIANSLYCSIILLYMLYGTILIDVVWVSIDIIGCAHTHTLLCNPIDMYVGGAKQKLHIRRKRIINVMGKEIE